jgi:hypothetical protein
MRYFLLGMLLFFPSLQGICQKKTSFFPRNSIIMPDSLYSCQLLDTISNIPFKAYNRHGKIPKFIKRTLNRWAGRVNIANPGWPVNIGCSRGPLSFMRPNNQLLYMGLHKNYMLIVYKGGTIGTSSPTMLFKFDKKKITNVWYWLGFMNQVRSKEDIINHLGYYSGPFYKTPRF